MKESEKNRRGAFKVMAGLIGMIKPLLGIMTLAVFMGCIGNLVATFLTVFGGYGLLGVIGRYDGMRLKTIFICIAVFAVMRGILRYAEQACNHYIAFKLLARIRHQVFTALRKLAPAKLDGSNKGNLISIITSDIELLEVFYAHTISPIAIAVITSGIMVSFIGAKHPLLGALALCFYVIVGVLIPLVNGKAGGKSGQDYRDDFGKLNTCVLDNLYGVSEILQYDQQETRYLKMQEGTNRLEKNSWSLKKGENICRIGTDAVILAAGILMTAVAAKLVMADALTGSEAVIAVLAMTSSFGPTAALSSLSNNLHMTLASGNRVLNLLEESPVIEEVMDGSENCEDTITCQNISFYYKKEDGGKEKVLQNFQAVFEENKIHGIFGKSGCGKSTLLKLLMRFYETGEGAVLYGKENVNAIKTSVLRDHISYVTQETFLFCDTIENNIKVAKEDATKEEVIAAAKKASVHDFIMSLPNGYNTRLAELGDSLSGGEKQRIGIARAFLHDSSTILLDEPTSNIDSLNEGIILKSLAAEKGRKNILLVSHRKSTMSICDDVTVMNG